MLLSVVLLSIVLLSVATVDAISDGDISVNGGDTLKGIAVSSNVAIEGFTVGVITLMVLLLVLLLSVVFIVNAAIAECDVTVMT